MFFFLLLLNLCLVAAKEHDEVTSGDAKSLGYANSCSPADLPGCGTFWFFHIVRTKDLIYKYIIYIKNKREKRLLRCQNTADDIGWLLRFARWSRIYNTARHPASDYGVCCFFFFTKTDLFNDPHIGKKVAFTANFWPNSNGLNGPGLPGIVCLTRHHLHLF